MIVTYLSVVPAAATAASCYAQLLSYQALDSAVRLSGIMHQGTCTAIVAAML
jgi:hypothetical protein